MIFILYINGYFINKKPSMRALLFILIALINITFLPTSDARTKSTAIFKSNPKICLVLSGGGARGFAHIGVLKYLEELHVPVHCITGTSMGAVVGGLYASGLSATDIEQRLDQLHLGNIALDVVDRRQLPQTLREEDANYPIKATFGITKNGLSLPLGAVQGSQFLSTLQNWTSQLPPNINFDQLPIPFRAVATDLESGEMVVFSKGSFATAIRASMAAPGVFSPIEINGRLLTDGGLVRNLPVDIAKGMGADIIIAVNLGTPLMPRSDLDNFFNVSQQMLNILTEQNVTAQKKLLRPADILMDLNLGTISFLDFDRSKEAFDIGYKTAETLHGKLILLSLDKESYLTQLASRPDPTLPVIKIAFVDVHSVGKIPADDIRRQINIPIGTVYNSADINSRLALLNNSRQYDSIVHTLVQRDGEYGIEISANERRWGPNFIRLGLQLSTGFDGMSGFELQLGHRLPWINHSGLEWRNDFQFGNDNGLRSELRQPLFNREGMYLAPYVDAEINRLALYHDNNTVAEYAAQTTQVGLDLGIPMGEHSDVGEVRTGFYATHYNLRPKIGGGITELPNNELIFSDLTSLRMDELAFHASFIIDQLDAFAFPSTGFRHQGEFITGVNRDSSSSPTLETHTDYKPFEQVTLSSLWAKSYRDNSLNLSFKLGARRQTGPALPGIGLTLGGFQQLSAYQPDQFFGNYLLYGNATYLFRAINVDIAGQAVFLGTSLELGNAADHRADFKLNNLKKSLSLFVGAQTVMGPIHFGIAAAPAGTFNLFLQLGRQ